MMNKDFSESLPKVAQKYSFLCNYPNVLSIICNLYITFSKFISIMFTNSAFYNIIEWDS